MSKKMLKPKKVKETRQRRLCAFCNEGTSYFIGWNKSDGSKGWGYVCNQHDKDIARLNKYGRALRRAIVNPDSVCTPLHIEIT